MLLDGSVDAQAVDHVHSGVGDGAENEGGACHVPGYVVFVAVVEKGVFLVVVEV